MSAESEGKTAAKQFREKYHLGTQPLGDLVALIEQSAGIDVAVIDANGDEHGMTMLDPDRGTVFIAVARTANPMRQRSTLAHELGHVIFEDRAPVCDPIPADRTAGERRADAFARHLLVPAEGLREVLGGVTDATLPVLSSVVQRYLVSPAIAAIALNDAGYISDEKKAEWIRLAKSMELTTPALASRFGWTDQYRALQHDSMTARAPQRLAARAVAGYVQGVVSVQTLATLYGRDRSSVETELREAGIVPAHIDAPWAKASDLPDVDIDLTSLDDDAAQDSPE